MKKGCLLPHKMHSDFSEHSIAQEKFNSWQNQSMVKRLPLSLFEIFSVNLSLGGNTSKVGVGNETYFVLS